MNVGSAPLRREQRRCDPTIAGTARTRPCIRIATLRNSDPEPIRSARRRACHPVRACTAEAGSADAEQVTNDQQPAGKASVSPMPSLSSTGSMTTRYVSSADDVGTVRVGAEDAVGQRRAGGAGQKTTRRSCRLMRGRACCRRCRARAATVATFVCVVLPRVGLRLRGDRHGRAVAGRERADRAVQHAGDGRIVHCGVELT